jgi:hypothetical protein
MATAIDLDRRGDLFRLDVLDRNVQEFRQIYASPDLYRWIRDVLPTLQPSLSIELSPVEQFFALAEIFCAGDRLTFDRGFKPLTRVTIDGIWELKTQDIRVFGWFHRKDCFIGVVADDATRIKSIGLYQGYANVTTKLFLQQLDLDEPKYIRGDKPHAVVSNFDYP